MENYVADKLIKILEGIKDCNYTMQMDDPSQNPDFEKDWYRPAERKQSHLVEKLINTIKEDVDSIAWK
jgi:hypothetical protein|tara:strand:+ start:48 stop:251 length:204 start_codon:yes stop_codon:yes gene_type:complete